jgi:hypothetical protein
MSRTKQPTPDDTAESVHAEFTAIMAKKSSRYQTRVQQLWGLYARARAVAADASEIEVAIGGFLLKYDDAQRKGRTDDLGGDISLPLAEATRFRKLAKERRKQLHAEHETAKLMRREATSQKIAAKYADAKITHILSQPSHTVVGPWHESATGPFRFVVGVDFRKYEARMKHAPVPVVERKMLANALADLKARDLAVRTTKPPPEKPPGGFPPSY